MLIDGDKLTVWLQLHAGLDTATILEMLPRFEIAASAAATEEESQQRSPQGATQRATQVPMEEIEVTPRQIVRKHAAGTSWEAALGITSEKRQRMYRAIYLVLRTFGPLTDDQIADVFERRSFSHSPSGARARRSELVQAGWIRDTGHKRPSRLGNPAIVWEAVPEEL